MTNLTKAAWALFGIAVCLGIAAASVELKETHDRNERGDTQNFLPAFLMTISKTFSVIHATHTAKPKNNKWVQYAPTAAVLISQILWGASAGYALHFDNAVPDWVCITLPILFVLASLVYCVYTYVRGEQNTTVAAVCFGVSVAVGLAAASVDLEDVRSRFRRTEEQEFVTNLLMGLYDGLRIPVIITGENTTLAWAAVITAFVSTVMWFVSAGEAIRFADKSNDYVPWLTYFLGPCLILAIIIVFIIRVHETRASTDEGLELKARENTALTLESSRPLKRLTL